MAGRPIPSLGFLLLLPFLLHLAISRSSSTEESSTCLALYREGGALAVFQSPKCPRWTLRGSSDGSRSSEVRRTATCQPAVLQGRRRHQEDRAVCTLDIRIPFPGVSGIKEISCSIVAVFDGHNGADASDMASGLLLEFFLLHVYFLIDGIYSNVFKHSSGRLSYAAEHDTIFQVLNFDKSRKADSWNYERSNWLLPLIFDGSFHMEILKESLLRTIHDIDLAFTKEAYKNGLSSGTTAAVALIADGQILVANIGDSKAFLCSEGSYPLSHVKRKLSMYNGRRKHKTAVSVAKSYGKLANLPAGDTLMYFFPKELTQDHHPDREDERARVEAAGGYVTEWGGVARVNGELALSRAIGDVSYKSYGVTSVPEVKDWQPLTKNDSYLIVASDGIFEKMTAQDICHLLWDMHMDMEFFDVRIQPLANYIVNTAYEKGSMDNLAAVVVPLSMLEERCDLGKCTNIPPNEPQGIMSPLRPADDVFGSDSSLISVDYFKRMTAKFKMAMVEAEHDRIGCFFLSENLKDNVDYIVGALDCGIKNQESIITWRSPDTIGQCYHGGGTLDPHSNNLWRFGFGNNKDQCRYPAEDFSMFIGLLKLLPFNDTCFNSSESAGYTLTDFRYVLKKRFDRGSYGEVWLAMHWNCSHGEIALNGSTTVGKLWFGSDGCNTGPGSNSSSNQASMDSGNGDLFILKRIMVERGAGTYLSGLREKYFGDVFLNASMSLGTASSELSSSFRHKTGMNNIHETGDKWDSTSFSSPFSGLNYEEGLMHIARYVESFESKSKEIWLVFRNEGISLSKLMYTAEGSKTINGEDRDETMRSIQVLQPSSWWRWLKTTEAGKQEMRNIIWQLLMALKSCHDRNITHRDIKPENMVICFQEEETGRCLRSIPSGDRQYPIIMRIIDFGSAMDEFTLKNFYGSNGPSRAEQTFEYAPPEALLNSSWFRGPTNTILKYDMWSVGVVMLELILGSPHVFDISARIRTLLDQHLHGWSEGMRDLAYRLRSLMEMCILAPGSSTHQHRQDGTNKHIEMWPASWKCSEEVFSSHVRNKDPLKLGFPNVLAMRLVRQLLRWDPDDRLSIDDALQHPYFSSMP